MKEASEPNREIKQRLIERLREFPIDSRLPSEREFAVELGVAPLTVNRALTELAWEGYIRRIPRRGTFLLSHERVVHTDPATGHFPGRAVVFAYPNYFAHSTWLRLREMEEQSLRQGMQMIEYKLNPESTYEQLASVIRNRDDVVGLVLMPLPDSLRRQEAELFDQLGCPVVILSPFEYAGYARNIWSIANDWRCSGFLKAKLLLDHGHTRLAYVHHEPDSPSRKIMLKGMRQAIREAGISPRSLQVVGGETRNWTSSREAGYRICLDAFARNLATGYMFDSLAGVEGASRAAYELRLRVPDDLSIVTVDNGSDQVEFFAPPLSCSVSDFRTEIRQALTCLTNPGEEAARTRMIAPHIIERASVAAPREVLTQDIPQT